MNAPLKPTAMNVLASNSQASSSILNELVSKMNAPAGGSDEQKVAFAKWLERHAGSEPAAKPAQGAQAVSAKRGHDEAQRGVGRDAKPEAKHETSADSKPKDVKRSASEGDSSSRAVAKKAENKTARQDRSAATAKANQSPKADKPEADDPDEVKFVTQLGEGAAIVRELAPPADVSRTDPTSMMAWLTSLAQSDAQLAQAQAGGQSVGFNLGKSEGRDDTCSGVAALQALMTGRGERGDAQALGLSGLVGTGAQDGQALGSGDQAALHGSQGGPGGLDISAWQRSTAQFQLNDSVWRQQAQALLQPEAKTQGGDGLTGGPDALAGLASAQAAQWMQPMGGEPQGVGRHAVATLDTPVHSPQFADALAEQVSVFVGAAKDDGPMTAELRLNPVEMGPIHIKIEVDGSSAQVDFAAAAAETRHLIESSLSMLSSALDEVGLSLTGGGVSSQASQQGFGQSGSQSQASGQPDSSRADRVGGLDAGSEAARPRAARLSQLSGLDLYA